MATAAGLTGKAGTSLVSEIHGVEFGVFFFGEKCLKFIWKLLRRFSSVNAGSGNKVSWRMGGNCVWDLEDCCERAQTQIPIEGGGGGGALMWGTKLTAR